MRPGITTTMGIDSSSEATSSETVKLPVTKRQKDHESSSLTATTKLN